MGQQNIAACDNCKQCTPTPSTKTDRLRGCIYLVKIRQLNGVISRGDRGVTGGVAVAIWVGEVWLPAGVIGLGLGHDLVDGTGCVDCSSIKSFEATNESHYAHRVVLKVLCDTCNSSEGYGE